MQLTQLKKKLLSADLFLEKHIPLAVALLVLVVLRIPNFFEPYWYGDEGIYLTLGQAMRRGIRLYAEIIDHKTPLIYYFALVQSQLGFRVLNLVWMLATTTLFYVVARAMLRSIWAICLALGVFVIFTTIPLLEGNIPNGELFVMGFVLAGFTVLLRTPEARALLSNAQKPPKNLTPGAFPWWGYVGAGVAFSLGILTKVPGLFDMVAGVGLYAVLVWWQLQHKPKSVAWISYALTTLKGVIRPLLLLAIGVLAPIVLSALYFITRGSGQAYLDFGLLYNFRYAGSWQLPFSHPVLLFLFSLPGKVVVLAATAVVLAFSRDRRLQLVVLWFMLTLVASTLSNRPYPHYFLQVMPAAAVLAGLLIDQLVAQRVQRFSIAVLIGVTGLFFGTIRLLDVWGYETLSYYQNFGRYLTGRLAKPDYYQSFDSLMSDNYRAANVIRAYDAERIFIWGTNPMLYALSGASPTGRFTVSFHIKDFNAYDETIASVIEHEPPIIVMMHNETHRLLPLDRYLEKHYIETSSYDHFDLWIRRTSSDR